MKKIFTFLLIFILQFSFAQDWSHIKYNFIKAVPGENYGDALKEKWSKLHKQRIEDGHIVGWDVWAVVDAPQLPFTHVITTLYNGTIDSMYAGLNFKKVFPDMTDEDLEVFYSNNRKKREIVSTGVVIGLDFAGSPELSDFAVMNFMKVKTGSEKSYEDMEKNVFKKNVARDSRVSWALQRRVDRYGTDLYWNYMTIDWYEKYSDILNGLSGPAQNLSKSYKTMLSLRDLRESVVLWKVLMIR